MKLKWCCNVDQLALPVDDVVSQNILLQWFLGLLLYMSSVWRLLWATIWKFDYFSSIFLRSLSLSLDIYKSFNILFLFISFHHITKHKPISYYRKRIKKCVTIYFFTTGKTKQTVILAMVDLNQFFIFTSEGTPVVPLSRYTPCINNTD